MINAAGKTGPIEPHAALSARENSASFAIIAAVLPSVQSSVSSFSSAAARATAAGYGGFALPEDANSA
jgi:hypothetical protein